MAKKFSQLADAVRADPTRAAQVDEQKRKIRFAQKLAELRGDLQRTQLEVAEVLKVSQANISRIERQRDLLVSTLAHYVRALGGRIEIFAVFDDDQRIELDLGDVGHFDVPTRTTGVLATHTEVFGSTLGSGASVPTQNALVDTAHTN